jgi:hypothetical protein
MAKAKKARKPRTSSATVRVRAARKKAAVWTRKANAAAKIADRWETKARGYRDKESSARNEASALESLADTIARSA